jgi:hypothetical protein
MLKSRPYHERCGRMRWYTILSFWSITVPLALTPRHVRTTSMNMRRGHVNGRSYACRTETGKIVTPTRRSWAQT